ncbi:MAG TPA: hypothetical protein VHN79_14040, partial [Lacunisphaera sp.]|nr:hypothetical protein [Lacunisphaera sp.]
TLAQLFRAVRRAPVSVPVLPPIDTIPARAHRARVSKKSSKVGESAANYAAKKPVQAATPSPQASKPGQVRYLDRETARKLTRDILDKRHDLFRKLAQ